MPNSRPPRCHRRYVRASKCQEVRRKCPLAGRAGQPVLCRTGHEMNLEDPPAQPVVNHAELCLRWYWIDTRGPVPRPPFWQRHVISPRARALHITSAYPPSCCYLTHRPAPFTPRSSSRRHPRPAGDRGSRAQSEVDYDCGCRPELLRSRPTFIVGVGRAAGLFTRQRSSGLGLLEEADQGPSSFRDDLRRSTDSSGIGRQPM